MTGSENIQTYFRQIRLEQVCEYLQMQGWRIVEGDNSLRIHFERQSDGPQTYRLSIPSSDQLDSFRGRLQMVIFGLTEVEDREAMDIARDMAAARKSPITDMTALPLTRLRVRNTRTTPLRVEIQQDESAMTLQVDEVLELTIQGPAEHPAELVYGESRVTVVTSDNSSVIDLRKSMRPRD